MWTALAAEFDTAASRAGREGLIREFNRIKCSDLTDQAITDATFISRLTSSLPDPLSGSMRPPSGSRPQRPLPQTLLLLLVLLCTRESVRPTAVIPGSVGVVTASAVVIAVVVAVAIVTPGPDPMAPLVVVRMIVPRPLPAGIAVAMGIRDVKEFRELTSFSHASYC